MKTATVCNPLCHFIFGNSIRVTLLSLSTAAIERAFILFWLLRGKTKKCVNTRRKHRAAGMPPAPPSLLGSACSCCPSGPACPTGCWAQEGNWEPTSTSATRPGPADCCPPDRDDAPDMWCFGDGNFGSFQLALKRLKWKYWHWSQ